MNPVPFVGGIGIALIALFVLLFFVIAPPAPRVAKSRRSAPGVVEVSTLTRVTAQATEVVDRVVSKQTARLFGATELEMAGVKLEPSSFLMLVISTSVTAAAVGALLGLLNGTAFLLAIVFAVLAVIGAKVVLVVRTSRRQAAFADQIDDTVQLLSGGLRAGHGLNRAVAGVAQDAESPMREELTRVVNETRLGRDLASSLAVTAGRMHSDDFDWLAQAVAINQETGGNLAEVLDQVGKTIRERNQIRRQVKSLSAEGRLSGIILVALPIGVAAFLAITQPNYFSAFFQSIIGMAALAIAGVLLIVGSIWMAFTVKVEF
ncbi:tight adherence protein B [Agromyces sp. CF514]|uniref:type II secretion system F family protein n=1 Tax=Agromyces sp. CF514 TaxID=1881031 RepID=UPI0008E64580|nr:type II secretion system F family protein [Agromyces sp. CF514]SFR69142.1 tight adherence protein B [Agromyces sp. CF514]